MREVALSIPTSKLEDLRCFICKGYLSCSPIRLLPNGNFICGQCNPLSTRTSIYRVLQLEAILSEALFPCQFMKRGCIQKILFGGTVEHESTCAYRMFTCPSLKSCSWEGFTSELYDHYNENHYSLIKENADFKFKLDQDTGETFMVLKENLVFVVKYKYIACEKSFICDIRYCRDKTEFDANYKIHLINASDVECSLNLKTSKCLLYDNSFYNMQKGVILNVHKCLEILNDPTCVAVVIDLKVDRACTSNTKNVEDIVNYDLLELIRCKQCKNYLIPPLFEIHQGGIICYNCSKNYLNPEPSNDKKIKKLVRELNYPCQWRGCNFVGKSNIIQTHGLSCRFRCYRCFVPNCNIILTLSSVIDHAENHNNAEYLPSSVYKTSFSNAYRYKYVYTIKNNVLITFKHCVAMISTQDEWLIRRHYIKLFSDLNETSISLQFEHQHCKIKSESFVLVSDEVQFIVLNQLPSCFKENDELSVIISTVSNEKIDIEKCVKEAESNFSVFTWLFTMVLSVLLIYACYITDCIPLYISDDITDNVPLYTTDFIANYFLDYIPDFIVSFIINNVTVIQ